MRKLAFVILAAALAVPAFAAPDGATDAPKPEKPKKERKICRAGEDTGSHMVHRVCKTVEEWAASDEQDRGKLNSMNHGASQN